MTHRIIVKVTDIMPQSQVRVQVLDASTRLPLFQFECNRRDLHVATEPAGTRSLHSESLDGLMTTGK